MQSHKRNLIDDMIEAAKATYLEKVGLHEKILEHIDKENTHRKNLPWYKRVFYPQLKAGNITLFEDNDLLFAEEKARRDLKLYEQLYYSSLYYTPGKRNIDKLPEEDCIFKIVIKVFKH